MIVCMSKSDAFENVIPHLSQEIEVIVTVFATLATIKKVFSDSLSLCTISDYLDFLHPLPPHLSSNS